jgi:dCMP deaminase
MEKDLPMNFSTRPSKHETFLEIAKTVSEQATCIRRNVGCVLVNSKNHILATGYNGVPAGAVHCLDLPCSGAEFPSGEGLNSCEAIHAEQNALLQCKDIYDIEKCYCTVSPCMTCVKLLLNTSCSILIFPTLYTDLEPLELWKKSEREYIIYERPIQTRQ